MELPSDVENDSLDLLDDGQKLPNDVESDSLPLAPGVDEATPKGGREQGGAPAVRSAMYAGPLEIQTFQISRTQKYRNSFGNIEIPNKRL